VNAQLKKWLEWGTIEQGAHDAIKYCVDNPDAVDLSDRYFVLLGATSAMGPLDILLKHGANIVAIDLNRDFIWKKIIAKAKASSGTLIMPYTSDDDAKNMTDDELAKVG
jgi:hypothetical protein